MGKPLRPHNEPEPTPEPPTAATQDPERPWLERLEVPDVSEDPSALRAELRVLAEIRAHREWVIDGVRQHVANLERELEGLRHHVANLEREREGLRSHVANLEPAVSGQRAHARNLEERLAEHETHAANLERELSARDQRLADLARHLANLERRLPQHRARLSERGILEEAAEATTPGLAPLFRAGDSLWRRRPDLQERFPPERAPDFWYWLLWHGSAASEEVAAHLLPEPPEHLMGRVVGRAGTPEAYRRSGLVDWWRLEDTLREAGFDPAAGGRVLDFGAGCGRILQGFAVYAGRCQLTGADVDEEAVRWCRAHLDFARFEALPAAPPTALAAGSFDAVYAYSVFSHLPEDLHRAWLEELARLAAPGAALALTVHGRHVAEEVARGGRDDLPLARELRRRRRELEERGFLFVPYRRLAFEDAENARFFERWDLDRYGNTFIFEPYVRAHWSDLFEIVAWHDAPDDWQDVVVLRRRE